MTGKAKWLISALLILALIFGFTIGILWTDLPLIKFNREVKLTEVFTLLVTISIGIFIPLLVKKWIEDNRLVKSYLVDEVKSIITILGRIKEKLKICFENGTITKEDKIQINYIFHTAELQITSFREQLNIAFPIQEKQLTPSLINSYYDYKDFLTDGPFMDVTFQQIDDHFYKEHSQQNSKIENHLKTLIQKIYKF